MPLIDAGIGAGVSGSSSDEDESAGVAGAAGAVGAESGCVTDGRSRRRSRLLRERRKREVEAILRLIVAEPYLRRHLRGQRRWIDAGFEIRTVARGP